jgi:hypothetical protein
MIRKLIAATFAAILALTTAAGLSLLSCQTAAAMSIGPNAMKEAAKAASVVQPAMTRVHRAHSDAETARHMHRHMHKGTKPRH